MRTKSKPNAIPSLSRAACYDVHVFSPCTDLEAMVDRYGAMAIAEMAFRLEDDIRKYGDSIHNAFYNAELNRLAPPQIRKKRQSQKEKKLLREKSTPHLPFDAAELAAKFTNA